MVIDQNAAASRGTTCPGTELPDEASARNTRSPTGCHSILSGAFAAARRREWTDRNLAESAKPPTTIRQSIPATSSDDVAKVIAEARERNPALGLYLWLVVVTGVRRGELYGPQIRDVDLDASPETVTDLAEPGPELQNGRVYSAGFFEDRWRRYPYPSLSRGFGSSRS